MPDASQAVQRKRPSPWAAGVAVGAIAIAFVGAWTGAIRRPFLDDDWSYLNAVQQPGWWHAVSIWNPGNGLYRPVLYLWFGLLHSTVGLHPLPYHVATAAVVVLVGVLTWRVAVSAGLDRGALVAGVVVILYPSVGFPISWTAAASSPISVAFALGAILVLLSRPVTVSRGGVAALLLLLGLLSREVVIMAPAIAIVVAWARPGGRLNDALVRSLPLWFVTIAYLALRLAYGARDPSGPYHQQLSFHALDNLSALVVRTTGLTGTPLQLQVLAALGLFCLLGATLVWSLAGRTYMVLAGLVWFGLGTIPVIFLVNQPAAPYYVDFALPGLALALGAATDLIAGKLPDKVVVVAVFVLLVSISVAGHVVSDAEFTNDFGGDTLETPRLIAQVARDYRNRPSGYDVVIVHSTQVVRDEELVTARGDLFRVVYHDPSLRVDVVP